MKYIDQKEKGTAKIQAVRHPNTGVPFLAWFLIFVYWPTTALSERPRVPLWMLIGR